MNKKLTKILIVILTLVLCVLGAVFGVKMLGQSFAQKQATLISENNLEALFNNFAPELKNEYENKDEFIDTTGGLFTVEPISEVRFASHQGNILGGTYRYHLVKGEDSSAGYTLDIEPTASLFGKKIKKITLQPVQFIGEQ